MKRKLGWIFAVVAACGSAQAAQSDWDSYIAAQLSPPAVTAKSSVEPARASRRITPALLEARRHWDELAPETQQLAARWLARPDQDGGDNLGFGIVYIDPAHESTRATAHFRIHYVPCATYPGDSDCATAAYINDLETIVEDVYAYQQTTGTGLALGSGTGLGYKVVPSDGTRGGDGRYDVYVAEIGSLRLYGYAAPEAPISSKSSYSYLVIDNNYTGFGYADPLVPLKVTFAHEYFHAVQMGYDQNESLAFMENSSTWMESMAYPAIHDNYQYIGEPYTDVDGDGQYDAGEAYTDWPEIGSTGARDSGSLDYPEAPLNSFGYSKFDLIQYGRFLWPQYLSEKFDADLMKAMWVECGKTGGNNAFAAMNTALVARGSTLADAYQEYATWGYDKVNFVDGANYPLVRVDGTVTTNADFRYSTLPSLGGAAQKHLSSVYVQIKSPSGDYRFNSVGPAALTLLVDDGSGTLTHQDVTLDAEGAATWTAAGTESKVIAVVSNVSTSNNCMKWALVSGTTDTALSASCGGGESSGGGGGAFDALALAVAALFGLRRRRS